MDGSKLERFENGRFGNGDAKIEYYESGRYEIWSGESLITV